MSTFSVEPVPCPCGASTAAPLAESANAARHPRFREEVLAGTFMRFPCGGCGAPLVVERELLYSDLPRGQLVAVLPSERRTDGLALEGPMRATFDAMAGEPGLARSVVTLRRMVFGYAELREKLVAADAGLDDRVVEALKLVLLAGRRAPGVVGLLLVAADARELVFEPLGLPGTIRVVPRARYAELEAAMPLLGRLLPVPPDPLWVSVHRVAAGVLASATPTRPRGGALA